MILYIKIYLLNLLTCYLINFGIFLFEKFNIYKNQFSFDDENIKFKYALIISLFYFLSFGILVFLLFALFICVIFNIILFCLNNMFMKYKNNKVLKNFKSIFEFDSSFFEKNSINLKKKGD